VCRHTKKIKELVPDGPHPLLFDSAKAFARERPGDFARPS
jgi:hypothetical protein